MKVQTNRSFFSVTPNLLDNPTFLSYYIKIVVNETVNDYMISVIRQGVIDNSITTDYPDEFADLIVFLVNIWLNPAVFLVPQNTLIKKIKLTNQLMRPFGIDMFNEQLIEVVGKFRIIAEETNKKGKLK